MSNDVRFKPLRPLGERKPDSNIGWTFKDPEKQRERESALATQGPFTPKPKLAPTRCPLCGSEAEEYRNEHNGAELLLPGGNPFICAACGNTEWNI